MKEMLDEQSRLGLIHYRLERADEAMEEARIMADSSHYNAAVNRLYYACFYAVQALLLKHHIAATTHAGVKSMLGLHFISKGITLQNPQDSEYQLLADFSIYHIHHICTTQ